MEVSRRSFIKNSTMGLAATTLLPSMLHANKSFAATKKKENAMFCYQCEQTMGGKGCTRVGICGPAVIESSGGLQPSGGVQTPWTVMLRPLTSCLSPLPSVSSSPCLASGASFPKMIRSQLCFPDPAPPELTTGPAHHPPGPWPR